jgi:hypothetical protein
MATAMMGYRWSVVHEEQAMRHAKLGTVLLLALAIPLTTMGASRAEECKKSDFDYLSDGSTDQTIDAILDWADCIKRDQQTRMGKYLCFIENSAGIEHRNNRSSPNVGPIKPASEKFFVEIKEYHYSKDVRRKICELAFGLLSAGPRYEPDGSGTYTFVDDGKKSANFSEFGGNGCLANYAWNFSLDDFTCEASKDTYECNARFFGKFSMNDRNEFDLFRKKNSSDHPSSLYVSQGKCEKIN